MQKVTEIGPNCYCGSSEFTKVQLQEKMLGIRDSFTYADCLHCGHAYLITPPSDLAKYYPQGDYYSFRAKKISFLQKLFPSAAMRAFNKLSLDRTARILDYGCGSGQFVYELQSRGYTGATGFDPFLPADVLENGTPLLRKNLNADKYHQYYDVITMNHVVEHLPNPLTELRIVFSMLKNNGHLIVRLPVKDSFAFKKYGLNWAQWDAPRHFHLFTRMSLRCLLSQINELKEAEMYDDSYHFQFTASEIYKRGGSLKNDNRLLKRILSPKTYYYFLKAKHLNKKSQGDQVTLIARKSMIVKY